MQMTNRQPLRQIALKVDVDTWRGTAKGVPNLLEMLKRYEAGATFLFALGPDNTGRAIKRIFRPGFLQKVGRTSAISHYGLGTLLHGTLLPGPMIGEKCADIMREVHKQGFETGIHCWDHVKWQDNVSTASNAWTEDEMDKAIDEYRRIIGKAPKAHGAAGWQMNRHAFRLTERRGFAYASDTRGSCPFIPVWDGEPVSCLQLPTTLPTIDELIGLNGIKRDNVAAHLLQLTVEPPLQGHVFTLHAELEGMKLAHVLEELLHGWLEQGYSLVSLQTLNQSIDRARLPRSCIRSASIPGRSGLLMMQGDALVEG